ncbi:MAG TPA: diguanylate cyclase [Gemmatimonadales bacterium]|jgi:two-component system cell cycle response regulator
MPAPKPHILIVDDDYSFARTLSRLLTENGYEAAILGSGSGLPEYMATRAVDLLILDLSLPGKDGLSLLEVVRSDPPHRDLPILVLTASSPEETSVQALGLGASDVLGKPVRVRELLARIRTHLRAGRTLNQARAEARSQAALVELLREITLNLPPRELFQVLVRQVAAGLRIPRCSILLGRPGAERATVVAASENPMLRELVVEVPRYPEIRRALESGEVVLVGDVTADPVFQGMGDLSTTSALVLPFQLRGERAGVFFLRTGPGDPPLGDADLRFATRVVESAAEAIEKSLDREESTRRQEAMRQLAETDSLTGLLNRRALSEKLLREVERATRYGTVLTCVMIDIDHFKAANDTHGHQAGDRVLVQFAELLRREQRSVDVVARYGGEEFVVLLPETGSAGARLFAERVLRRVSNAAFGEADTPIPITVSLGLATFPDERASDAEALLRLADRNLLRAKSDGRNRYRD